MEELRIFSDKLSETINYHDKSFILRYNKDPDNNKFNLINTLYASSLILNSTGIDSVISELETDNIVNASKNALIKKRNEIRTNIFIQKINEDLLNILYNKNNGFIKNYSFDLDKTKTHYIETDKPNKQLFINKTCKRFVGCDGMQLNVSKNAINNDNVKTSKNGLYGITLISGFFDIMNKIPISYYPTHSDEDSFDKKKANETKGFLQQINKLTNNDIVVYDRWYFSNQLHKILISKNIGYIFRMKNNSKLFKDMHIGKHKIVKFNRTDVQLFKYKIKNEIYCILTSITENITVGEIKALYWRRWKIETDNKKFKYDILRTNIRSKKINSIYTDIECIKFISILSSIIEYFGHKYTCRNNKKINSRNCLAMLYKKLLYVLMYDNKNYTEICRLVGIVYKKVVSIISNRSYERKRISASTKWNEHGNRFGNSKKQ